MRMATSRLGVWAVVVQAVMVPPKTAPAPRAPARFRASLRLKRASKAVLRISTSLEGLGFFPLVLPYGPTPGFGCGEGAYFFGHVRGGLGPIGPHLCTLHPIPHCLGPTREPPPSMSSKTSKAQSSSSPG